MSHEARLAQLGIELPGPFPPHDPLDAVVVPGSRAVNKGKARDWGISLYAPVIVKYRDEKTDRGVELEDWLR